MGYSATAKHRMLAHLVGGTVVGSAITHASLHTAFPATSGNEIAGGTPAYARKAVTFAAPGTELSGSMDMTSAPVFDVPTGVTVSAVGFWTAATNGTLMADADVTDVPFSGQGTYTLNDADAHLNL